MDPTFEVVFLHGGIFQEIRYINTFVFQENLTNTFEWLITHYFIQNEKTCMCQEYHSIFT